MLMRLAKRRGQKGFTLIELLIVVAIIGIIAAILIPNLLDALQKAKQKATVGDIRNIGTAWMSWVTDQMSAAAAGQSTEPFDWTFGSPIEGTELAALLEAAPSNPNFFYIQELPTDDGWGTPLEYRGAFNPAGPYDTLLQNSRVIAIRSLGRDGSEEGTDYTPGFFIGTDYDQDIVWSDGYFVRAPGGVNASTN
ncbi:MAG TPA: prepilin-type N-terminal cleavage/methylation domain-containing protein [Thermoanaerobaculia bacterium]|jgi:prepilin-type N-terminal cleavage/methylation domain-containing protein|nr:prepilin-type N-terminal cleavage/methylation domain-containing protein [Thermoanaerobaculia bacterium]